MTRREKVERWLDFEIQDKMFVSELRALYRVLDAVRDHLPCVSSHWSAKSLADALDAYDAEQEGTDETTRI